ncbi:MAG: dCTP deaminase [Sulfobacillus thermosulfidooxidans]|uniref:dCTP deaminase n=1 Tax=Sulfobacillus thermotolerans TaxID=338644 RepID=A0ABN5H4I7_9FIRM|nr:dCTP deaminase [Sulfobacillus sp. hq2]AUW95001.1 dCTP deaminase [Sulfobacillus thermotolerans]MCY0908461.1 dCTP deaminase [Sulfobacillus thermotolerans]POB10398.1 dCTP deaminase [Sulfobacillus sp. hq2]PSR36319.1 MAG: dCTP deaminase [Sulfobacillus thermosulfidooxidans]
MVMGEAQLRERMQHPVIQERLVVTPLLSDAQVKGASIDVRLGTDFILMKRSAAGPIDPMAMRTGVLDYQERARVEVGEKMILHPNQLVLGVTLEFIQVPRDLMAYVIGRSSWGRLGLMVATAVMVSPGYRGSLTLELANLADTPVYLYPGTRVAQLVFHQVDGASSAYAGAGKYTGPVGPEFSKLSWDEDWQAIQRMQPEEM